MAMLTVRDIMTEPVETIGMDRSLRDIRAVFERSQYHHIVVRGDDGACVGVISDRDLLKHLSPFVGKLAERSSDLATLNKRVHQIMTRQLVAVRPRTTLRDAARVMLDHKISCLPVLDETHRCIGIVTLRDIVRWAADSLDELNRDAA